MKSVSASITSETSAQGNGVIENQPLLIPNTNARAPLQANSKPEGDMFILDMDDPWDLRYVRTVQTCRRRYVDMVNVVTYTERIRLFAIIQ